MNRPNYQKIPCFSPLSKRQLLVELSEILGFTQKNDLVDQNPVNKSDVKSEQLTVDKSNDKPSDVT